MALTSARAIHKRVAALQVLSSAAAGRDKYIQFVFENQSSKLVNSILVGFALIAMTAMCRMPPGQKAVHACSDGTCEHEPSRSLRCAGRRVLAQGVWPRRIEQTLLPLGCKMTCDSRACLSASCLTPAMLPCVVLLQVQDV